MGRIYNQVGPGRKNGCGVIGSHHGKSKRIVLGAVVRRGLSRILFLFEEFFQEMGFTQGHAAGV